MEIATQIRNYLVDRFSPTLKGIRFTENTLLLEEKVLDSLGMLELISFVEVTFNIEVPDEDLVPDHFGSIEKLAKYIESNVKRDGSKRVDTN